VIKEAGVVGVGNGVADPTLVNALVGPLPGLLVQVVAVFLDLVCNKMESRLVCRELQMIGKLQLGSWKML